MKVARSPLTASVACLVVIVLGSVEAEFAFRGGAYDTRVVSILSSLVMALSLVLHLVRCCVQEDQPQADEPEAVALRRSTSLNAGKLHVAGSHVIMRSSDGGRASVPLLSGRLSVAST